MIPQSFDYLRAKSIEDAVSLLSQHRDSGKLLAGGQSIIPAMKLRLSSPSPLIDISGIRELTDIKRNDGILEIGALVTHRAVEFSEMVKDNCEVLSDAAAKIGDPSVRNRGTIGGNLAHADPAADYPALVQSLGAEIHVLGKSGDRTIASDDFFTGLFETALTDDEIITRVDFPVLDESTGAAYEKFRHPASRLAVVGVAAMVKIDGSGNCIAARVSITGAAASVFRAHDVENALVGNMLDEASISNATKQVADAADLMGEVFASEEYRAQLCSVISKRALIAAMECAKA